MCLCIGTSQVHSQQTNVETNRGFSVRDSIEMTTFSDPYTRYPSETCKLSPDGKHFMLITTRGLLQKNELESRLWVLSGATVEKYLKGTSPLPPHPRMVLRVVGPPEASQSNSYGSLITAAEWSSDSLSILTLVEKNEGHRHIVRTSLSGVSSIDLTPGRSTDVESFSEAHGTIAYLVRADTNYAGRQLSAQGAQAPSVVLTGSMLFHILYPKLFTEPASFTDPLTLWVHYKGANRKLTESDTQFFPAAAAHLFRLAVSPDGDKLIAALPVPDVLPSWFAYQSASSTLHFEHPLAGADRSGKDYAWPWEYSFVDLETRTSHQLVAAPSDYTTGFEDTFEASWSRSGKEVLFTSSYLPLPKGSTPSPGALRPCAAAIYSVPDGTTSCLAYARFPERTEYLRSASFGDSDEEILLRWLHDGIETVEVYERRDGRWVLQTGDQAKDHGAADIVLSLHQDIDIAPSLWATNETTGIGKILWNPNPQLAGVALGRARVYRWKDSSGYNWRGGLVLPPCYVPGHRYPLVLQTHGFYNDHEFLVDGSFTTGFAAQPLAAAGIVVLQMEDREDRHLLPAQQEASMTVMGIEAAIDRLDKDGLIDPARVGIIGFSRTHWYVEQALIHSPQRYKAATLIDGVDQSYVTRILFGASNRLSTRESDAANGTMPFGPGLEQWFKTAAGFNLDKVQAAVRIEAIGPPSILGEWETYSSLFQQGKPVDFIEIPNGQHILQRPRDRYVSQQGNVDWYRFWLQAYERPNPEDPDQYKRWEHLRELRDADTKAKGQGQDNGSKPN
jgi:hypothetical protein